MKTTRLLPLLVATTALLAVAQDPIRTLRPRQDGGGSAATRLLDEGSAATSPADGLELGSPPLPTPTGVLFDAPTEGRIWAAAPSWKAGFDTDGATFVPFFGSAAPANRPVHFAVLEAEVAGVALDCEPAAPVRNGDIVAIPRRALVEQYATSAIGMEQRFRFDRLPARGPLTVTLAVDGDYSISREGDVHRFRCELGSFTYGAPIAVDAAGRSTPMTAEFVDGTLTLAVPGEFVQRAELPLLIDPIVGNVVSLTGSIYDHATSDVCFDASLDEFAVVYERVFSQTDSDVLVVRCDRQLNVLSGPYYVDSSTTSWRRCRIAGLDLYDKHLVVAECEGGSAPTWIAGRTYAPGNNTMSLQFDIQKGSKACRHPDVGGDPALAGPVFWTVVFEYEVSGNNRDIMMRQVTETTQLRGNGMVAVDNSPNDHRAPAISKSNGKGAFSQQAWCIVYRFQSFGGQSSIVAAFSTWNGQLSPPTPLTGIISGVDLPLEVSSQSSDTLGRVYLVADAARDPSTNSLVLFGTVVNPQGNVLGTRTPLSSNSVSRSWPVVETDGTRFVLGYSFQATAVNWSTYASTYDLVNNHLVFRSVELCGTGTPTPGQGLCALGQAQTSAEDRNYVTTWNARGQNGDVVRAVRYAGMAPNGGVAQRPTGCGFGTVALGSNGDAGAIGTHNVAYNNTPTGLAGWVIGLPMSQPIAGCTGCIQGASTLATTLGSQAALDIPYDGALVGVVIAFQAFEFGPGACLGALAVSDTIDLTVR
ncbi:MAG: hypothetical protein KDE27_29965 [Planctomycetes bacterium]|nr:hypothetical protein [Planctomycetota bacterium]